MAECINPGCEPRYPLHIIILDNIPYVLMLLLGGALVAGAVPAAWAWPVAIAFVVWGLLGSLAFMLFLCPHCPQFGRACPCGYGLVAVKLRPRGELGLFPKRFRIVVAIIAPLWFIPLLAAGWGLYRHGLSWLTVGLMVVFAVNSFVILPMLSKAHACQECPQKDDCPWMGQKANTPAAP
jgi:hypothetical protein